MRAFFQTHYKQPTLGLCLKKRLEFQRFNFELSTGVLCITYKPNVGCL